MFPQRNYLYFRRLTSRGRELPYHDDMMQIPTHTFPILLYNTFTGFNNSVSICPFPLFNCSHSYSNNCVLGFPENTRNVLFCFFSLSLIFMSFVTLSYLKLSIVMVEVDSVVFYHIRSKKSLGADWRKLFIASSIDFRTKKHRCRPITVTATVSDQSSHLKQEHTGIETQ